MDIHDQIVELALEQSEAAAARTGRALHRRETLLRVRATVYRLLKAHELITSPAYVGIKAADRANLPSARCATSSSGKP